MAEFHYGKVSDVYTQMKGINGEIKTLLTEINTEVSDNVDKVDKALFGDLGAQMLLNWENISSNFPNFIDNFENWAALVAKSSGDYSQFETDVAGFKALNPYGATSGGIQQTPLSASQYNGYEYIGGAYTTSQPVAGEEENDGTVNDNSGTLGDDNTGDDDRNVGGGSFGDESTTDETTGTEENGDESSTDETTGTLENGDESNTDVSNDNNEGDLNNNVSDPSGGSGEENETYKSVTLESGDVVEVGGQNMRFYGAYSDPRGTSVNMYADNQGNLFFEDGSPVKLSRVASNGQTVYVNASLSNVGTYVTDSHGGHSWPSYWKMNDADGNIISESNLASSVTYEDDSQAPNLTTNDNMGALIENDNSITQGAKLRDSYVNASTNDVVNGHTVAVPSSMQGLSTFIANGTDVIRIDPQYKVEWDPSSAWGNGYDFDTSNGPVYLMKSDDGTYYNLCDEYGNIINDKHFTPDGFNVEHGNWK